MLARRPQRTAPFSDYRGGRPFYLIFHQDTDICTSLCGVSLTSLIKLLEQMKFRQTATSQLFKHT